MTSKCVQYARNNSPSSSLLLAPGVQLDGRRERREALVLRCPSGQVLLNQVAVAILRLCDGSLDRDGIIAQAVRLSRGTTLASDIDAFLDAAQTRGWVVEAAVAIGLRVK